MKAIKFFYLERCPYCKQARRALDELKAEDAKYDLKLEWIEESKQPEVADHYDYYNVPCMFIEDQKVYEAKPGEDYETCKSNVQRVLDLALA
ncbi:MAG: glutaredoxin family protein [Synergistaceae bacterium]|nr:glutaredoxin family protein [Synergistaceae bacterium]